MENVDYVYHASKKPGLKILEPRESTHKTPWVYATKDIATSAMFLGDNYDFIVQTGFERDDLPFMFERFEGALEHAYKGKKGVIYKLPAETIEEGKTSWRGDLVSESEVEVVEEINVDDALVYLEKLEREGKLKIFRYPEIPEGFPSDKSDIVEKAVIWTMDIGEHILDEVEKYHPDVLGRVLSNSIIKDYEFKDVKWKDKLQLE